MLRPVTVFKLVRFPALLPLDFYHSTSIAHYRGLAFRLMPRKSFALYACTRVQCLHENVFSPQHLCSITARSACFPSCLLMISNDLAVGSGNAISFLHLTQPCVSPTPAHTSFKSAYFLFRQPNFNLFLGLSPFNCHFHCLTFYMAFASFHNSWCGEIRSSLNVFRALAFVCCSLHGLSCLYHICCNRNAFCLNTSTVDFTTETGRWNSFMCTKLFTTLTRASFKK